MIILLCCNQTFGWRSLCHLSWHLRLQKWQINVSSNTAALCCCESSHDLQSSVTFHRQRYRLSKHKHTDDRFCQRSPSMTASFCVIRSTWATMVKKIMNLTAYALLLWRQRKYVMCCTPSECQLYNIYMEQLNKQRVFLKPCHGLEIPMLVKHSKSLWNLIWTNVSREIKNPIGYLTEGGLWVICVWGAVVCVGWRPVCWGRVQRGMK